ncbi:hypothetical protein C2G38_1088795 [Gigaspora rosea]|uniref:Uncharacterized protein n=1 Tax=Gigaspora rosea TaxID=44941 RepID=A0A397TS48_9GLOM|nr:hypothetical protein C2G38_1088795 [Gigaspora rosea]
MTDNKLIICYVFMLFVNIMYVLNEKWKLVFLVGAYLRTFKVFVFFFFFLLISHILHICVLENDLKYQVFTASKA